jgi:hypothetical protein
MHVSDSLVATLIVLVLAGALLYLIVGLRKP